MVFAATTSEAKDTIHDNNSIENEADALEKAIFDLAGKYFQEVLNQNSESGLKKKKEYMQKVLKKKIKEMGLLEVYKNANQKKLASTDTEEHESRQGEHRNKKGKLDLDLAEESIRTAKKRYKESDPDELEDLGYDIISETALQSFMEELESFFASGSSAILGYMLDETCILIKNMLKDCHEQEGCDEEMKKVDAIASQEMKQDSD